MKSTNNNCDFMVGVCARNTDTTISSFKTKNGRIVIATINTDINDIRVDRTHVDRKYRYDVQS